jgi:hypothetical protein
MTILLYEQLSDCMDKEAGCYRQLVVLARWQKELLVAAKIQELPVNVQLEEKQVFSLGPLVSRRNELLQEIAKLLEMKTMNLSQAMEKVPGDVAVRFREAALRLVESAKELESVNQGNDKLLKNALSYVNFTLKAISAGGRPSVAARIEKGIEKPASSFLNRKV